MLQWWRNRRERAAARRILAAERRLTAERLLREAADHAQDCERWLAAGDRHRAHEACARAEAAFWLAGGDVAEANRAHAEAAAAALRRIEMEARHAGA